MYVCVWWGRRGIGRSHKRREKKVSVETPVLRGVTSIALWNPMDCSLSWKGFCYILIKRKSFVELQR
jgi:hypothetical protein